MNEGSATHCDHVYNKGLFIKEDHQKFSKFIICELKQNRNEEK